MEINSNIFRAYDIRGIAGTDLTPETIYEIGRAFGSHIRKKYDGKKIVVGRDNRTHGEDLQQAYISGLLAAGCEVTNIGLATSPMLYWAVCKYGFDGGTNITASHNPKEYNGCKLVARNAHSVCGDEIREIFERTQKEEYEKGKGDFAEQSIFADYIEDIKSRIHLDKKFKIVIDAGNGVAGKFAPELFRELGCDVVELFCELDGTFPNHEANPEHERNMEALKRRVLHEGADLGIGFDGDGDRVGIIDEKGEFYQADYALIPLARDMLSRHPGTKIIFDTKCSKVLENDIIRHGGVPIRYKTGHSFIEAKMKKEGSLLAGETSGHIFMAEKYYGFDDAMFAAALFLEVIDRAGKPFSSFFMDVPHVFNTPEIKAACSDDAKFNVVEDMKEYFVKRYPCLTIDGVLVDFGDDAWGAVRASNTSPFLTLRFEAKTKDKLDMAKKILLDKLREYPEVTPPE